MKALFYTCLVAVALPGWAWAGDGAPDAVEFSHCPGSTVAMIGTAIMCAVELLRSRHLGALFERIPRRWRIALPVLLSGMAGILWRVVHGEQSWQQAVYIGLFAGPTAVFAHEAVVEAILGHARRREERASTEQIPATGPFTSHRGS